MRRVNVVVEVFIDVEEDGTAYAEALMLRNADKYLLAQGFACVGPKEPDADPVDEGRLAARALVDLADTLIHDTGGDGAEERSPSHPLRTG
jgi:hypothetical protein